MSKSSTRNYSLAVLFILALSGLSFGFLVTQSQQQAEQQQAETTQQLQNLTGKVKTSTALVTKGAEALRRVLVQ